LKLLVTQQYLVYPEALKINPNSRILDIATVLLLKSLDR